MLHIYENAETVLVWLGEHTEHSELVLRCLDLIEQTTSEPSVKAIERLKLCDIHQCHLTEGLQDLSGRSWYRRMWVKQELYAAKATIVVCGDMKLKWSQFWKIRGLAKFVESEWTYKGGPSDQTSLQRAFEALLREVPIPKEDGICGRKAQDVCDILTGAVESQCSDPRDRVYGILGIAAIPTIPTAEAAINGKEDVNGLTVDYQKSTADVYIDLMEHLLKNDRSLSLMYRRTITTNFAAHIRLPSWAFNWSDATIRSVWTRTDMRLATAAHALDIQPQSFEGRNAMRRRDEHRALSLRGNAIGTVVGDHTNTHCTKPSWWHIKLNTGERSTTDQESSSQNIKPGDCKPTPATIQEEYIQVMKQALRKGDPHRTCYCTKCVPKQRRPLMLGFDDDLPNYKIVNIKMRTGPKWPDFFEEQSLFWYMFHLSGDLLYGQTPTERQKILYVRKAYHLYCEPGFYTPKLFPFRPSINGVESLWWVPETTLPGDLLVFAQGGELPFVIRANALPHEYVLIGPAMLVSWPGKRSLPYWQHFQRDLDVDGLQSEAEMFLSIRKWLLAKQDPTDEEIFNLI